MVNNHVYLSGNLDEAGIFAIRQFDLGTLKKQQEYKFGVSSLQYDGKVASEDILLWIFPIENDFLVAVNGPDGYKLIKYEENCKKGEL